MSNGVLLNFGFWLAWLVHPAAVVGVLVRIDVAAVLVEVDVAVLLAHVDLELASGAAALPAVVVVAESVEALTAGKGETAARRHSDVDVSKERAAELGEGEEFLVGEEHGERDEEIDGDEVLGLDHHREGKQHKLHVS